MREELEQKIVKDFPWTKEIYSECGDGWFQILYDCVNEINEFCKVNDIDTNELVIVQIKEKFGELRIYMEYGIYNLITEIEDIIAKYVDKSQEVCEVCGKTGRLRVFNRYYKAVCDEYANKFNYKEI